ncbi:hypothetical protein LTR37_018712 [Vermiconidia calcicola]|uniref:Uncharacterized protein n=1 Tax=Vermiconidia calcicola TaxID=1690605 RepID=A0ACC3MG95_9PEZI|nr:hypothetical protein LTR37_018712 [Vermiconidia calcicola]
MASPFTFSAARDEFGRPENDTISDSEYEHLNLVGQNGAEEAIHFWYGKQLLAQHLAESIAKSASVATPISGLDVSHTTSTSHSHRLRPPLKWSLTQAMASFSYSNVLVKLQESGLHSSLSSARNSRDVTFSECIVGLGSAALQKADQPGWISNFLAEEVERPRTQRTNTEQVSGSDDLPIAAESRVFGNAALNDDPDLPRYTMALKEIGDAEGGEPRYSITQLSLVPPLFKAVVRFGGSTYEGEASTKKKAKHLASKNACSGLDIPL